MTVVRANSAGALGYGNRRSDYRPRVAFCVYCLFLPNDVLQRCPWLYLVHRVTLRGSVFTNTEVGLKIYPFLDQFVQVGMRHQIIANGQIVDITQQECSDGIFW